MYVRSKMYILIAGYLFDINMSFVNYDSADYFDAIIDKYKEDNKLISIQLNIFE